MRHCCWGTWTCLITSDFFSLEAMGSTMLDVKQGGWVQSWVKGELHQMLSGKSRWSKVRSNCSVRKQLLLISKGGRLLTRKTKNSQCKITITPIYIYIYIYIYMRACVCVFSLLPYLNNNKIWFFLRNVALFPTRNQQIIIFKDKPL